MGASVCAGVIRVVCLHRSRGGFTWCWRDLLCPYLFFLPVVAILLNLCVVQGGMPAQECTALQRCLWLGDRCPPSMPSPLVREFARSLGNIQRLHAMNARIITYTHTHFAFSAERAGGGAPLCRLPGAHGAPAAHAACQGAAGRYACGGCGWAACVGLKVRVDIGGQLGSVASLDVIPQRCFLVPHCLAASLLLIMSLATIPLLSPSLAARG